MDEMLVFWDVGTSQRFAIAFTIQFTLEIEDLDCEIA
jgi:hypothetical protein